MYNSQHLELKRVYPKEDVTVVIGVKNRCDYRLDNALKSVRNQSYPQDMINIILVDYDSSAESAVKLRGLAHKYNALYLRANNRPVWSRSRCLNIGIKKTRTKYLLLSDVDIIFEKNYISAAVRKLKKDPFQVAYCPMRDSLKGDICGKTDVFKEYYSLGKRSIFRSYAGKAEFPFGSSICFMLAEFVQRIRGLDEMYLAWGKEDQDLIRRLKKAGLKLASIGKLTSHIHQYHFKFEGLSAQDIKEIGKNRAYFSQIDTLLRNKKGWGLI